MNRTDIIARSFVVFGALRSGTTLLRLMLDGHPRINCPGEMDFLIDHLGVEGRYDRSALEASRIYRAHKVLYPGQPLQDPQPEDLVARVAGKGDALAGLILHRHLERTLDIFPGIRVLHLMRDPRDVAHSSIGMGWAGNTYYGVDHWIATQRDWQSALLRLTETQRLVIRYEDLIKFPEKTLKTVCAFIGLSFHPSMLEYDASSTYAQPDPVLAMQWKHKQTPREIGLVEAKIGSLLRESGYAPSGHPPVIPGAPARVGLWLQNKRSIWGWRIRRYGVTDPLLVKIADHLGLTGLARSARRRMDAVQIRHLK
ncbi:sulfotransferase [uncultured Roseobacter sp.]|uniref:sulfotransferase family protein n=1 Tax=uncultured Roseobacter sp. TaxID=114847 RepID=UPI00262E4286|nr:sulfotransferase [uncultured Roseobacter sp.]